jgi:hypothetical protein
MEVEDMDEAMVAAELERAFGEKYDASEGERHLAGSDADEALSEGGSNGENSWAY